MQVFLAGRLPNSSSIVSELPTLVLETIADFLLDVYDIGANQVVNSIDRKRRRPHSHV